MNTREWLCSDWSRERIAVFLVNPLMFQVKLVACGVVSEVLVCVGACACELSICVDVGECVLSESMCRLVSTGCVWCEIGW